MQFGMRLYERHKYSYSIRLSVVIKRMYKIRHICISQKPVQFLKKNHDDCDLTKGN